MQRLLLPVAVVVAGLLWRPVDVTLPEKAEWTVHHVVTVKVEPVNANVAGIPSLDPLVPPEIVVKVEASPSASVDVFHK